MDCAMFLATIAMMIRFGRGGGGKQVITSILGHGGQSDRAAS